MTDTCKDCERASRDYLGASAVQHPKLADVIHQAHQQGQAEEFERANLACQRSMKRLAKRVQAETYQDVWLIINGNIPLDNLRGPTADKVRARDARIRGETLAAAITLWKAWKEVRQPSGGNDTTMTTIPISVCNSDFGQALEELQPAAAALEAIKNQAASIAISEEHERMNNICDKEKRVLAKRMRALNERLRKVARQYGEGGHTHRERAINAIADEFDALDLSKMLEGKK